MPASTVEPRPGGPGVAPDWAARFARRASLGGDELTAILSLAASTDVITFSGGFPAPETFPVDVLQELLPRLAKEEAAVALQYSPTEGLLPEVPPTAGVSAAKGEVAALHTCHPVID